MSLHSILRMLRGSLGDTQLLKRVCIMGHGEVKTNLNNLTSRTSSVFTKLVLDRLVSWKHQRDFVVSKDQFNGICPSLSGWVDYKLTPDQVQEFTADFRTSQIGNVAFKHFSVSWCAVNTFFLMCP